MHLYNYLSIVPKKRFTPASNFSQEKTNDNAHEKTGKHAVRSATEIRKEVLFSHGPCAGTTRPYPLLRTQWYEKIGIETEIRIKESKGKKETQEAEKNVAVNLPYPLLSVGWYEKVGLKQVQIERDFCLKTTTNNSYATNLPFHLLTKSWYQRRGVLAAKNIVRKKTFF